MSESILAIAALGLLVAVTLIVVDSLILRKVRSQRLDASGGQPAPDPIAARVDEGDGQAG